MAYLVKSDFRELYLCYYWSNRKIFKNFRKLPLCSFPQKIWSVLIVLTKPSSAKGLAITDTVMCQFFAFSCVCLLLDITPYYCPTGKCTYCMLQVRYLWQKWGIVRSAKRCHHCILGWLYSAYLRLESQNLTCNPCPPTAVDGIVHIHATLNTVSKSGALASSWQNTSSPKYNDDISLLILQYLISELYC